MSYNVWDILVTVESLSSTPPIYLKVSDKKKHLTRGSKVFEARS